MIGVIFNHDMFDDPYNQNAVKKACAKLNAFAENLGEKLYSSFGARRNDFESNVDEYVVVHYTCTLSTEQKSELAGIINELLTLKKSAGIEKSEKVIVFDKKSAEDCFEF
ncbi:MAG: hypothetical protein E7357_00710 [Clostridiales bacterium]|nr:hypothetical protein [Clostridiales bacterium]